MLKKAFGMLVLLALMSAASVDMRGQAQGPAAKPSPTVDWERFQDLASRSREVAEQYQSLCVTAECRAAFKVVTQSTDQLEAAITARAALSVFMHSVELRNALEVATQQLPELPGLSLEEIFELIRDLIEGIADILGDIVDLIERIYCAVYRCD